MTSFLALANFEGEIFPSKLVFGEATQVFHGALMESCSWRDCALGEIFISLGKIIMLHYFMFRCKLSVFKF